MQPAEIRRKRQSENMIFGNGALRNGIKPTLRLLLVGLEPQTGAGLRAALPDAPVTWCRATPADDIPAMVQSARIDVLLIDRDRYGSGAMSMIDRVNTVAPQTSIILLAERPILVEMITAVKLQVADVILKPATVGEIMAGIRKFGPRYDTPVVLPPPDTFEEDNAFIAERAPSSSDTVVARAFVLNCRTRMLTDRASSTESVSLSLKETAILAALMRQAGRIVSCRQLALAGWTKDLPESKARKLVRPHISRLRKKLKNALQLSHAIVTVDHQGYVFSGRELSNTN